MDPSLFFIGAVSAFVAVTAGCACLAVSALMRPMAWQ